MKSLRLVFCLLALALVSCSDNLKGNILNSFMNGPPKELFKVYHYVYEKEYELNSQEGVNRYRVFKDNLKKINEVNSQTLSYEFGVNQFTDLTPEEFRANYLMKPEIKKTMLTNTIRNLRESGFIDFDTYADEDEVDSNFTAFAPLDWRKLLKVPRDQGYCGSCWTFATAGVVEGAVAKKYGKNDYLSTQELVDCDISNGGCNGGIYDGAIAYAVKSGLSLDVNYPYKAVKGTCKVPTGKTKYKLASFSYCSNYTTNKPCTEDIAYKNLAKGPTAVGIDGYAIQMYKSGIFSGACTEDNHAVVVVGFGTENGQDYWIVRNSWSSLWGEAGHIRVARNSSNKFSCFVANESWSVTAA